MKKLLLALMALFTIAGTSFAMQFDYNRTKFNVYNAVKNLQPNQQFTITNVPGAATELLKTAGVKESPLYIKDEAGNPFAKNTASKYPYSGTTTPGKGTLTYTVLSLQERQKLAKTAAPKGVLPAAAASTGSPLAVPVHKGYIAPIASQRTTITPPVQPQAIQITEGVRSQQATLVTPKVTAEFAFKQEAQKPIIQTATIEEVGRPVVQPITRESMAKPETALTESQRMDQVRQSLNEAAKRAKIATEKLYSEVQKISPQIEPIAPAAAQPVAKQVVQPTITPPALQAKIQAAQIKMKAQSAKEKAQFEENLMKISPANLGQALVMAIKIGYIDALQSIIAALKKRNININDLETLKLKHSVMVTALQAPRLLKITVLDTLKNAGAEFQNVILKGGYKTELFLGTEDAIKAADYDLTKWLIDYGLTKNLFIREHIQLLQPIAQKYAESYGSQKLPEMVGILRLIKTALTKFPAPAPAPKQ